MSPIRPPGPGVLRGDYGGHFVGVLRGPKGQNQMPYAAQTLAFSLPPSQMLGTDLEVEHEVPLAVATAISDEADAPAVQQGASYLPASARHRGSTARAVRQLKESHYVERTQCFANRR
uniref:Uncharacterized protein n=1 Tax=Rhodosorus marinus TaxID=101924 RepID=A0A7S2ZS66_9RHOD|mmetsp:Transcript_28528/g.111715  ORF Transcript_28528/g.111715 Transcript_28528/m.111715 type:complete len:118 (+) Transcript_28528:720-1073(+)